MSLFAAISSSFLLLSVGWFIDSKLCSSCGIDREGSSSSLADVEEAEKEESDGAEEADDADEEAECSSVEISSCTELELIPSKASLITSIGIERSSWWFDFISYAAMRATRRNAIYYELRLRQ
tara:strand:+ start:822 stop:1190 length:369 start_codon:yes stop_codon:yes gene_type:complete